MNILLVTPVYKLMKGSTLVKDTEAIHHLARYWTKENNVNLRVLFTYLNPARRFYFFFNYKEIKAYKKLHSYKIDDVDVLLTEIQQWPFQSKFDFIQNNKIRKGIIAILEDNFIPDIIVAHFPCFYTDVINMQELSNIPKVAVLHSTDIDKASKYHFFVDGLNNSFDKIYGRSKVIANDAKNIGINVDKNFIVSSGVPFANNISNHKEKKESIIKVLFVGKLIKRKHADYIIKSLGKIKNEGHLPHFLFTIIGEGPQLSELKRLVTDQQLNNCVEFCSNVSREMVYDYMRNSDVFIMPSVHETLGLVYLEAMMNGCITVGTKNEGIDGIIEHGTNGFLVEPNSLESVYKTLKIVFNLDEISKKGIKKAAIDTAKYYNEKDMSIRYMQKLIDIVNLKK